MRLVVRELEKAGDETIRDEAGGERVREGW